MADKRHVAACFDQRIRPLPQPRQHVVCKPQSRVYCVGGHTDVEVSEAGGQRISTCELKSTRILDINGLKNSRTWPDRDPPVKKA